LEHRLRRPPKTYPSLLETPLAFFYISVCLFTLAKPPLLEAYGERRNMPSYAADTPDQSQSLPPEIDLSPFTDPSTPPEHLVDAVRRLEPSLPIGCGLFGQGDLKIVGSRPIDAGGFADIWVGEMNDGTTVAIKSLRYYSSSSSLPICLVSGVCTVIVSFTEVPVEVI